MNAEPGRRRWGRIIAWMGGLATVSIALAVLGRSRGTPSLEERWGPIEAAVQAGRWDEATPLVKGWLADDRSNRATRPRSPALDARSARADAIEAELWLREGDAPAAIAAFEALRVDPGAIAARRRLVYLYTIESRAENAREVLWELYGLTHDARDLLTITTQAAIVSDNRDVEPILARFLAMHSDVWLVRARALMDYRLGKLDDAWSGLRTAAERIENDPTGRLALADCLLGLGTRDGLETALGDEPTTPRHRARWWRLKARIAETAGRAADAVAALRAAVAADPRDSDAHYRLGQMLRSKPLLDQAQALRDTDAALASALNRRLGGGRDASAFEELSRLCARVGLDRESRGWLEQAVATDPTRSDLQGRLAATPSPRPAPFDPPRLAAQPVELDASMRPPDRSRDLTTIRLDDVAERAGLVARYDPHPRGDFFIADTMGGGGGLIDFDGDGWLDVYLVGGCPLPVDPRNPPSPNRLFRNRRDGTFEDVTMKAGVGGKGYGMGCAVGDFDNDGHDDLFVTGLGRTVLYRNRGDGTFDDVTERAGVASDRWTTAAGFADLDGDGDLDLVAITYVAADPAAVVPCLDQLKRPIHCPPNQFPAQVDHLFRNNGDGTFTDVAHEAGLDVPNGDGLGLAIADLYGDGRLDLFVANDAQPNFLFRNKGGLTFEEVGVASGVALNGSGKATASMGVAADDLDGDGRIDLFHADFNNEPNTFLRNLGGGQFVDATADAGLAAPSVVSTGFGVAAVDLANSGRLDLFVANGHVDDQPWFKIPMAQPPELYVNRGNGRFALAPATAVGPYLARARVGRGVMAGDLDNDGRVDLVVVHRDAPVALLRNTTEPAGHWLGVKLVGGKSGKTAIGASVVCVSGGRSITRWRTSGTGYLSQHDDRLRFGLGSAATVETLRVTWPSGLVQDFQGLQVDRVHRIEEGRGLVGE